MNRNLTTESATKKFQTNLTMKGPVDVLPITKSLTRTNKQMRQFWETFFNIPIQNRKNIFISRLLESNVIVVKKISLME